MGSSTSLVLLGRNSRILCHRMKLSVVMSVCLLSLDQALGQRQTEDNRSNGQAGQSCSIFNGCIGFQHRFDPIGKINQKLNKIKGIFGFKANKIRKVFDVKNAVAELVPAKLQLEIDTIRGVQSALSAKLAVKTALKGGFVAANNVGNGLGNVFNRFFPPPPQQENRSRRQAVRQVRRPVRTLNRRQ